MRKLLPMLLCICLLFLGGCGNHQEESMELTVQTNGEQEPLMIEPPQPITLTIAAVGDNLLHNTLSFDSRLDDGSYDFYPIYAPVAPIIQSADLAIVNQEVPLNGEVGGYPYLAAPQEAAVALQQAGFDVATLANNHTADQGADGMTATIDALQSAGIATIVGASKNPDFPDCGAVVSVKGIDIGILSYTYGLNVPFQEGYVNITEEERLREDIHALRAQCDFLIVAMHWGNEYQSEPSSVQREQAQLLADLGVNLIIGHHPHVMQPMEWITSADGGQTLCAYSLGNFVSNQHKPQTMLGGLLWAELTFFAEGEFLAFTTAEQQGVVTHFTSNSRNFAIYPLDDYTESLAEEHGIKKHAAPLTLTYLQNLYEAQKGMLNSAEE